jgi:hypothetical protein
MKSKRKSAIKGIILFASISLLPVAVLFAGTSPEPLQNLERVQLERSVKQWKGLHKNLNKVLNKANQLNNYRAIK